MGVGLWIRDEEMTGARGDDGARVLRVGGWERPHAVVSDVALLAATLGLGIWVLCRVSGPCFKVHE